MISRRALLTGSLGAAGVAGVAALSTFAEGEPPSGVDRLNLRIDDMAAGTPISPYIYGSGETGNWDGNGQSVTYDLKARVTIRRLGGNMFSTYNWRNNAANAGKDWRHENGAFLLEDVEVDRSEWTKPAAVIDKFLEHSRAVGVPSLLGLPLAGYVAADFNGPVEVAETAPSRRFLPVDWSAPDRAVKGAVNIPALVALLKARHGGAARGGMRGYYLDNEPGLWTQTHPRVVSKPTTIKSLIERSLRAAMAIKAIDPDAWVLGPTSWGAMEFTDFQKAPDWPDYRQYGSFLGAYLAAFRAQSERVGHRLLDHMDVHWYPVANKGTIYATENADLSQVVLDAPRSLDDPGFCEQSWVADVLGCRRPEGITLPLLPSLEEAIARHYPGTGLSFGEYNYGGAGLFATGLAMADALGRFGRNGVTVATHWGSLAGMIGEAFKLYRLEDAAGEPFGETSLPVAGDQIPLSDGDISVFAARSERGGLHLVTLNKGARPISLTVALASGRAVAPRDAIGFDALKPGCVRIEDNSAYDLILPPRSARRFRLA